MLETGNGFYYFMRYKWVFVYLVCLLAIALAIQEFNFIAAIVVYFVYYPFVFAFMIEEIFCIMKIADNRRVEIGRTDIWDNALSVCMFIVELLSFLFLPYISAYLVHAFSELF